MQIAYSLEEVSQISQPIVLTIGSFDGMHLGHQAIMQHLLEMANQQQAISTVITFINHPSTVLKPLHPTPLLSSVEHKKILLEKMGIDLAIFLPFTKEFSDLPAEVFLQKIRQFLPIQTLILGSDSHIGKNREGDQTAVKALANSLGFAVEYFSDSNSIYQQGKRVTSSLIRECIQQGLLQQASALLGRPYSICGKVLEGEGKGKHIGFPTANLDVEQLCLPPLGVYAVSLSDGKRKLQGIANLGLAPTMKDTRTPILEVHIFDFEENLYGKIIDVEFQAFIRQERKFGDVEELRKQIAQDLLAVKALTKG